MKRKIDRYQSSNGARIYRIPLEVFPGFWGYSHLVSWKDGAALVDVGSGFGESNAHLEDGLGEIGAQYGQDIGWGDLTHILISHGHIDHFGGLHFVRHRTRAMLGIHELDLRVLDRYEERLSIMAARLRTYLARAGLEEQQVEDFMDLYLLAKQLFSSIEVDFTYEAEGMALGPIRMIHVPGHCPGQVMFQVGDILLSGDHILEKTTPHQSPERLSLNTGLSHYLESLAKTLALRSAIRLTLGGHEGPISDLAGRIQEIQVFHYLRLQRIMALLDEPKSISQVAQDLFGEVQGYEGLLAIEEAGAHVEYLMQRSYLETDNWQEYERNPFQALRYKPSEGYAPPLRIPGYLPERGATAHGARSGGSGALHP